MHAMLCMAVMLARHAVHGCRRAVTLRDEVPTTIQQSKLVCFMGLPCLQVMLLWWQQWVQDRQQQQELLEHSCCHMKAYTAHRCASVMA